MWNWREQLSAGVVIPAHPLCLTAGRQLDEEHQRGLTRYYLDSGAGGLAVGVHTTQFTIRDCGLLEPVLKMASEEAIGRQAGGPAPGPLGGTVEQRADSLAGSTQGVGVEGGEDGGGADH